MKLYKRGKKPSKHKKNASEIKVWALCHVLCALVNWSFQGGLHLLGPQPFPFLMEHIVQHLDLPQINKLLINYIIAIMFTANSSALVAFIKLLLSSLILRKNKYFIIL